MSKLTKTEIRGDDGEVAYFYFEAPEMSSWSRFEQAKPVIEEIKQVLESMKAQADALHRKSIEIASYYQRKASEAGETSKREVDRLNGSLNELQTRLEQVQAMQTSSEEKIREMTENRVEIVQQLNAEREKSVEQAEQATLEKASLNSKAEELQTKLEQTTHSERAARDELKNISDRSAAQLIEAAQKVKELSDEIANLKMKATKEAFNTAALQLKQALSNSTTESSLASSKNKAIKIKMNTTLQTFSGRPDDNINEWLYQTNRILEVGDYNDYEKVTIASSYLRELASQDYMLQEQATGKQTWKDFSEYMRRKYTPANLSQIIRDRIKNLKQIVGVKDFYVDFRKLSIQAPGMNEEERLSWFINGLKPSIAAYVNLQKPKDIDEAYDTAVLFETYTSDKPSTNIMYTG
jgi:chromosome segregation ATPase